MLGCSRQQALQLTQDQEQTRLKFISIYFSQGEGAVEILFLFSFENNKKYFSGWGVYIFKKLLHKYNSLMISLLFYFVLFFYFKTAF